MSDRYKEIEDLKYDSQEINEKNHILDSDDKKSQKSVEYQSETDNNDLFEIFENDEQSQKPQVHEGVNNGCDKLIYFEKIMFPEKKPQNVQDFRFYFPENPTQIKVIKRKKILLINTKLIVYFFHLRNSYKQKKNSCSKLSMIYVTCQRFTKRNLLKKNFLKDLSIQVYLRICISLQMRLAMETVFFVQCLYQFLELNKIMMLFVF